MRFTTWNRNPKMKVILTIAMSSVSMVLILLAAKNTGEPVCYSIRYPGNRNIWINKAECRDDSENIFMKFQSEREVSVGELMDATYASLSTTHLPSFPTTDSGCSDCITPNPGTYVLHKTKMSWSDAVTACYQYGKNAHLAFIESEAENNFIIRFIEEKLRDVDCAIHEYFCDVWIGLNGKKQEGVWKWYNTTVQLFGTQTVDESGGELENCGRLATQRWEWRDTDCNDLHYSICEI